MRKFMPWYVKYAALHGPSFVAGQCSISLKLSKRLRKYSHFGPTTVFLHHRLRSFDDIENRRRPKDAPYKATYFTYQALKCLINIDGLNWAVHLKNRRLLMW
jgi:hypothetical protein